MNISLTKPLEAFVQSKIDSGMYVSASEVIRAGLRALSEQEIDKKIKVGLEQENAGLGEDFNNDLADELLNNVHQRITNQQNK